MADWLRGRLGSAEPALAEWSPSGGRQARATWRCGSATTWARSSAPKAAWARRSPPTGRGWSRPAKAGPRLPAAGILTWAWPRCCTNGPAGRRARPTRPRRCAVPAAGFHPVARDRPCPPGPDPPGAGRCGRGVGRDRPGGAGRVEPRGCRPAQPGAGVAGGLLLARGEVAEATRWATERGLSVNDQPSYPREGEYLALARLLLAQQRARPGVVAHRAAACPGGSPRADRRRHRGGDAAGAGACRRR